MTNEKGKGEVGGGVSNGNFGALKENEGVGQETDACCFWPLGVLDSTHEN
jgi:hypothetical protein